MAHFILLQGTTSTSENYRIALNFAKSTDPKKHAVLFVICIHNYHGDIPFTGFRMNSLQFSAHPDEKEVLLAEGTPVAVMGTDEVLIDNAKTGDSFWEGLNGKTLTIVYMFHAFKSAIDNE